MGIREHYDRELKELDEKILAMAQSAAAAVELAMEALAQGDVEKAQAVIDGDDAIDRAEHAIEHLCLGLIACQQPVAGDLRKISAAMKAVTDLERLGDAAEDIALLARRRGEEQIPALLELLCTMGSETAAMLRSAIRAYAEEDLALAARVIEQDDVIDDYFRQVKASLPAYFTAAHPLTDCAIDDLMVAKYLERIGDHAVNLAEWVQFSKTGVHKQQRIV